MSTTEPRGERSSIPVLGRIIVMTVGLGFLDHITGYELGFFVFYFIPIAIAAWRIGSRTALGVAAFCGLCWGLADYLSGHPYSSEFYRFWNTIIRMVAFLIIGFMVAKVRSVLREEQAVSAQLRDALGRVKTLSGLLPICSHCKRVRNDKGYWEQVEVYVRRHTEAEFSHGICEQCLRAHYPQFAETVMKKAREDEHRASPDPK